MVLRRRLLWEGRVVFDVVVVEFSGKGVRSLCGGRLLCLFCRWFGGGGCLLRLLGLGLQSGKGGRV